MNHTLKKALLVYKGKSQFRKVQLTTDEEMESASKGIISNNTVKNDYEHLITITNG